MPSHTSVNLIRWSAQIGIGDISIKYTTQSRSLRYSCNQKLFSNLKRTLLAQYLSTHAQHLHLHLPCKHFPILPRHMGILKTMWMTLEKGIGHVPYALALYQLRFVVLIFRQICGDHMYMCHLVYNRPDLHGSPTTMQEPAQPTNFLYFMRCLSYPSVFTPDSFQYKFHPIWPFIVMPVVVYHRVNCSVN